MEKEIEKLRELVEEIFSKSKSRATPIAELDLTINSKEAYVFSNREGLLKIASKCLALAAESLDGDGAHIHLDMDGMFLNSEKVLVLELRNDWEVE